MTKISLQQFINETKGKRIDVPWGNGNLKGQCVSLVQQYLGQCLGQPMKARGNAKDWKKTYVNEGLGKITKSPKYGDIIVYDIGQFGHIAIYINSTTLYDQNNGYHDNYKAGYGSLLKGGTYLRPNVSLIPDSQEYWTTGIYKLLYKKAWRKTHKITNNIYQYVKAGTDVRINEIYKEGTRVWGKCGAFWFVLCNKDGTKQATKIG